MKSLLQISLMLYAIAILSACTHVQVWERANISKAEMSWEPDLLAAALEEQIYLSKEASSGGVAAAGGGCGCN